MGVSLDFILKIMVYPKIFYFFYLSHSERGVNSASSKTKFILYGWKFTDL